MSHRDLGLLEANVTFKDRAEEGIGCFGLFTFFAIGAPAVIGSEPTLSLVFILLLMYLQKPLVALQVPHHIQLHTDFGFPNPIPACLDNV